MCQISPFELQEKNKSMKSVIVKYPFKCGTLVQAMVHARPNRFIMEVELQEENEKNTKKRGRPEVELIKAHSPVTGAIEWLDLSSPVACLMSPAPKNSSRSTSFTVEALRHGQEWRGINQVGANAVMEFFLRNNLLDSMLGHTLAKDTLKREQSLGDSRIDFCCNNAEGGLDFIEVKSPLQKVVGDDHGDPPDVDDVEKTLNKKKKRNVPKKKQSSEFTHRLVKHLRTLSDELKKKPLSRAFVVLSFQWNAPIFRPPPAIDEEAQRARQEILSVVREARENRVEFYQVNSVVSPDGIHLGSVTRLGDENLQ